MRKITAETRSTGESWPAAISRASAVSFIGAQPPVGGCSDANRCSESLFVARVPEACPLSSKSRATWARANGDSG